jgi:hypothetical protein
MISDVLIIRYKYYQMLSNSSILRELQYFPFRLFCCEQAYITKFFHTNSCTFTYNYVLVF